MGMFGGRIVKPLIITVMGMLLMILIRLGIDQTQWYGTGVEKIKSGDKRGAIMYFDKVLNAHIPYSPIEKKAKNELLALATGFEVKGENELALLCYETIRTSRYLARHFRVPDRKDIPFLNEKIAAIKARLLVKEVMAGDFTKVYDQQMRLLDRDYSPSASWSFFAVTAFAAYIVSVVLWIIRRRGIYIFAFCSSLLIWVMALYKA